MGADSCCCCALFSAFKPFVFAVSIDGVAAGDDAAVRLVFKLLGGVLALAEAVLFMFGMMLVGWTRFESDDAWLISCGGCGLFTFDCVTYMGCSVSSWFASKC